MTPRRCHGQGSHLVCCGEDQERKGDDHEDVRRRGDRGAGPPAGAAAGRERPSGDRHDPPGGQDHGPVRGRGRAGGRRRPRPGRGAGGGHGRPPRCGGAPAHRPGRRHQPPQVRPGVRRTNRLRTEGTDHLLEAARAAGASRFVAQSFAGWPFAGRRAGQDRGRPARPRPAGRAPADPGRHPVPRVGRARGRGPGGGRPALRRLLRPRHLGRGGRLHARGPPPAPLPGDRRRHRRESFVHIDDAATATLAALERGAPASTRSSTTTRPRCRPGCRPWPPPPGPGAAAGPGLAGPPAGRRARRGPDDRGPRRPPTPRPSGSSAGAPPTPSWRQGFRTGLGLPSQDHALAPDGRSLP